MLKIIYKILTIFLLLLVLGGAVAFMLYPKYPSIVTTYQNIKGDRIIFNTTLSFVTTILPPNQAAIIEDISSEGAMEHIDPEEIKKLKNEGKILFNMEEQNTMLTVQSAGIKGDVVDNETPFGMEEGFWHFPLSSAPGMQGNTVIIAHRFKYIPPRPDTFFNLDKVKVGDKIIIDQTDGTYRYTVIETKVVEKDDRTVLANTTDYRITLITCTPLWTSDKRLVVIGKLDRIYGNI